MNQHTQLDEYLSRIAFGDRLAFETLYRETSGKLFAVCLRVLKTEAQAEAALQETYLRVWEAAVQFRPAESNAMNWLVAIARNRAVDRLRANKPVAEMTGAATGLADLDEDEHWPEHFPKVHGSGARVLRCLDELPQDQAQALRRAYLDGDTYGQLADQFDMPEDAMRAWFQRGLVKLSECLSK